MRERAPEKHMFSGLNKHLHTLVAAPGGGGGQRAVAPPPHGFILCLFNCYYYFYYIYFYFFCLSSQSVMAMIVPVPHYKMCAENLLKSKKKKCAGVPTPH